MLASSLLSKHLSHPACIPCPPKKNARHCSILCCRSSSSSPSPPDLPLRSAQPGGESNIAASDRTAGHGPAPLAPTTQDPSSFTSCGSLLEMIGWFQQHGLSQKELQPGLVAPVAQKVVDLWDKAAAEDQPAAVAHLAEVAPKAIAFSLHNSTGLKARAAVQCTIALGKLPAVDPTVLLSLVEPASGVRQGLSTVPPAELVSMLEVLAGARVRPGNALLGAIMSELGAGMGQLPGPALASLLWALVVLGVKPTATWLDAHEAAFRATLQELGPQHLGRLAWASGRLGLSPGPAWLAGFCGASSHALAHARWDGSQLCGFMEGCAALPALGAVATQLWRQELLKVSGALLPSLSAPDLVAVLRAVSELQLYPGPLWLCAAWERAFAQLLPSKGGTTATMNSRSSSNSSSSNSSSSSSSSTGSSSRESRGVREGVGAGSAVFGPVVARGPAAPVTGAAFSSRDLADLLPLLLQLSRPNNPQLRGTSGNQDASKDSEGDEQHGNEGEGRQQSGVSASSRSGGDRERSLRSGSSSASSVRAAAGMDAEVELEAQRERLPVALVGRRPRKDMAAASAGSNLHAANTASMPASNMPGGDSMSANMSVPASSSVPGAEQGQPRGRASALQDGIAHQQYMAHEREVGSNHQQHVSGKQEANSSVPGLEQGQPPGHASALKDGITHQQHVAREQEVMHHPSPSWMAAYLSNVLHALPRTPAEALPKVLQAVAWVGASPQLGWLDAYAAALTNKAAVLPSPSLTSAALLLLQLSGLQTRPFVRTPSPAPPSTSQPPSKQPPTPQLHIRSMEHTKSPSKVAEGTAVNTASSNPVPGSAANGHLPATTKPASVERAGHHLEQGADFAFIDDEGPGYRSHRGTNSSIVTAEGPAAINSPAISSVLHALWAQMGGPNAASLSDEHLTQSIHVLAFCGIPSDHPQQEKVALNALQPRLLCLPRLQLIGLGEAVLKLQMQPDHKWWSTYMHRLQQCLKERSPMPPAACSALLWTIVTAGLYVKPSLMRLLSAHIRAAVEGGAVEVMRQKGGRLKHNSNRRTQGRTARGRQTKGEVDHRGGKLEQTRGPKAGPWGGRTAGENHPAHVRIPKRSRGTRPARSVKLIDH